jgi:hypothetical protein
MPPAILDLGTENLIDSQVRVDEKLLARCSAAVGREHIGIKGLREGDSAGIVAGEGRLDLGCDPRFQPRHGLWTHLGRKGRNPNVLAGFFAPIPIWSQATRNSRSFHVGACRAQRRCRH